MDLNAPTLSDQPGYSPTPPRAAAARPRWWLVVLTLMLVAGVWYTQRPEGEDPAEAKKAKAGLNVKAPGADPLILMGKLVLAMRESAEFRDLMRQQVDGSGLAGEDPAGRVREAMLLLGAGYEDAPAAPSGGFGLVPAEKAPSISERLDKAAKDCDAASELLDDIKVVRSVLDEAKDATTPAAREEAVAVAVAKMTPEQTSGLKTRHGWFAEVLLSANQPQAPVRVTAENQTTRFLVLAVLVGGAMLLAFLAGLVLLIIAVVMLARGTLKSHFHRPPALGTEQPLWAEHIWLETVCIFAGGFLAIKLLLLALGYFEVGRTTMLVVSLGGNWALTSAIFWPVVRGLGWKMWRERIGWRTNTPGAAGLAREVGCGILGYLCALPVMVGTTLVVFIIGALAKAITGEEPISPRQFNKVEELLGSGNIWITVVVFLLAVVWAPIVEESIFRGALYRHLRRGWPVIGAGLVSAMAFAAMHPYALLQMIIVGSLGLVFAMMREWRGSLVPSATAHFIQNSFARCMMLAIGPLMKG